jgi:hypothetical protein
MSHLVTMRRSGWNAVLAPDAVVGVVLDDTVGQLLVGIGGTALQAGRLEALVARHRQVEPLRLRIRATLDLPDAPPRRAGG